MTPAQSQIEALATRPPANQPLPQIVMSPSTCSQYIRRLRRCVMDANVLCEPETLAPEDYVDGSTPKFHAVCALNRIENILISSANSELGITLEQGKEMREDLHRHLGRQVLIKPAGPGAPSTLKFEAALLFLHEFSEALTTAREDQANCLEETP